jgi:redox-sensitive bicupin YhaK (pirin superfamily)
MSNLELDPPEVVITAEPAPVGIEILEPREVPLGGPRARPVRRTLPQRSRSLIGGWCFLDHYGPDPVTDGHGMVVPSHPHTGLQTVSWLFAGEIEHRDSVGSHAMVRPGELNLMTAGRGIAHVEVSTPETSVLHGAQLWIALPDDARHSAPFFERYVPEPVAVGPGTARVFIGSLAGSTSTARVFSDLVGAQIDIPEWSTVTLVIDAEFEHGVLVDAGEVTVNGASVPVSNLGYLPPGLRELTLSAGDIPATVLLIGGRPLGEQIVMWWNFIGRTHEEIVRYRTEWQSDVISGGNPEGRFGLVRGYDRPPLPAPEMPAIRLKPRT